MPKVDPLNDFVHPQPLWVAWGMSEAPRQVRAAVKQVLLAQMLNHRSDLRMRYVCTPDPSEAQEIGKAIALMDWALAGEGESR